MERTTICEDAGAMTRVHSTTAESGCSERDETSTCVLNGGGGVTGNASAGNCETSMWEEWTQATSTGVDEVSTSNFLPELTSSVTTSRLSFQHSDMLATWMSSFHPLAQASDLTGATSVVDSFMHHEPSTVLALDPSELEVQAFPLGYHEKAASLRRRALGPLSPSSPLAVQNGLLNPLGDPWDSSLQWSTVTTTGPGFNHTNDCKTTIPDHLSTAVDHLKSSSYGPRHTDIFIGPNGTFESATPGGWTPQLMYVDTMSETTVGSSVTPMKLMASWREAAEASSSEVCAESKLQSDVGSVHQPVISEPTCSSVTMSSILADCKSRAGAESTEGVWPGKHRLELVELVNGEEDLKNSSPRLLKKPKVSTPVDHAKVLQWGEQTLKVADLRSYCPSSSSLSASQAMDIIAIGPALNTNGKPRARRGSATDPQSVYARHRREKINERLKNLQNLVPNGAKVDIVTMLDEAINYVKFLQNQLELLKSDDYWMYATPNNYNGMDLSQMCPNSQELQSSAS